MTENASGGNAWDESTKVNLLFAYERNWNQRMSTRNALPEFFYMYGEE